MAPPFSYMCSLFIGRAFLFHIDKPLRKLVHFCSSFRILRLKWPLLKVNKWKLGVKPVAAAGVHMFNQMSSLEAQYAFFNALPTDLLSSLLLQLSRYKHHSGWGWEGGWGEGGVL